MPERPSRARWILLALVLAAVAALLLAGSDDHDQGQAGGTTTTSTSGANGPGSSAPISDNVAICGATTANSPSQFDERAGTYATLLDLVSASDATVTFDVVQWLSGEEANRAYEAQSGDPTGAPNDDFIVNESDQLRTAPVASDAEVWLLAGFHGGDSNDITNSTPASVRAFLELPDDERHQPFWLTFADGTVTGVCEQYTP